MKKDKAITETATIKFETIDDVYSKYSTDKHKVLDTNASTFINESFKDMQSIRFLKYILKNRALTKKRLNVSLL